MKYIQWQKPRSIYSDKKQRRNMNTVPCLLLLGFEKLEAHPFSTRESL